MILTGPNMSGKSVFMRQAALLVILAQMGGFVPARSARIGLVDRILTRVGAQDNLARGQSTFLVEMVETASILHHATPRSLILLDEVGRGTSTFDGLAIAWAVTEELHERGRGAKVLFATHYHELTALADRLPRVRNFHVAVKEWNDEIIFLHKVRPGGTDRSYGIQVARLAGLPPAVIARAKAILGELERERSGLEAAVAPEPAAGEPAQLGLFPPAHDPLAAGAGRARRGAPHAAAGAQPARRVAAAAQGAPVSPRASAGCPITSSTRSPPARWWSGRPRWSRSWWRTRSTPARAPGHRGAEGRGPRSSSGSPTTGSA